ncbi:MAG: hypothetical protein VZR09_10905 [Candidatus Gastranaerophilaceae bacterium]|nr:hypothetical protein [Candidatus Gastranaerophilaceae bacterium]
MKVEQIYSLMNNVTSEVIGKTDIVKEDLSNVVDLGKEIFDNASVDNYVKSLVNHIGKVIFVNRPYSGNIPSMLMDSWEFGSVLEKISADIPNATENDSWNLTDGETYSQDVFYKPSVSAKFFNSKVTFEVPMSFTELQVKESFSSVTQLNGFVSMIYNSVDKSMAIKIDSLVMRTINSMIANTVNSEITGDETLATHSGTKAVNLLKDYNEKFGTELTVDKALTTPEFIRYASFIISTYKDRLSKISTLFNVGGKERFTPSDMLNIVMLSDFKNSASVYLESDTYHNELVALPNCESVPYWQGSGKTYSFADTSKIDVAIPNGNTTKDVSVTGILAIMYDRDSMGVCNSDRRVTTNYNAKAEFYNNYYKFDASYFNDLNENFVVFYIA